MTFAVHDGSTGCHDHKEMDVFVGLTSPSNPQYSGVHFGINLGRGGGARLSFHYLSGHNFCT